MLIKRTLSIVAVLAFAFTATQIAQADIMTYNGMGLRKSVDVKARHSLIGRSFRTSAGQMKLEYQGEDYLGYCVDLNGRAGTTDVTEAPYSVLRNGSAIAYLFETNSALVTHREHAAGLQVAIWELLYENNDTLDFNLDTGNFKITDNNVIDDANAMLDDMRTNMPLNYEPIAMEILVLQSPCKQDMLIGRDSPVVPEPTTALLLGIGSLVAIRRRRLAVA
ncbi:MAG: PEP-CTERM sorting domain-containing protein [bacterium]|nr:PEP-CTERM sorting domain-containing protein [bacterium]